MDVPAVDGSEPSYLVTVVDGALRIALTRHFDFGTGSHGWARAIVAAHPGPFAAVEVDLAACVGVSSTCFAGLVELHQAYGGAQRPVVLRNVDPRTRRNLDTLHLTQLFAIR